MKKVIIYDPHSRMYLLDPNTHSETPYVLLAHEMSPIAAQMVVNGHTVGQRWVGCQIIPIN